MNEYPNLATLSAIGEVAKPIMEDLGIDTKAAFESAMDTYKDLPASERVAKAMQAMSEEILTKAPVWMRINLLSHKLATAKRDQIPESELDWNKINEYLTKNVSPVDYNNFSPVHSIEEFEIVAINVVAASANMAPWRHETCKDCGATFYLNQSEIEFYINKGLDLPKRCHECRASRKQRATNTARPEESPAKVVKEDLHPATAMEAAMRKAGLVK